jgi:hypothetical protein
VDNGKVREYDQIGCIRGLIFFSASGFLPCPYFERDYNIHAIKNKNRLEG